MSTRLETSKKNLLHSPVFDRDVRRDALGLSTGFWSVYLISHWTGAQYSALPLSPLNYYGFIALTLVILGLLYLFLRPAVQKHEPLIDWICSIGMVAVIPLTFYMPILQGDSVPTMLAFVANALFSTWLLVRWGTEYTRRPLEQAFLALTLGAVIVSCLKMGMAVIPKVAMMAFMMAVPVVSYIFLRRAASQPDAQLGAQPATQQGTQQGTQAGAQQAAGTNGHAASPDSPEIGGSVRQLHKVGGSFWLTGIAILIFLFIWSSINMVSKLGNGHYGYGTSSSPLLVLSAQLIDLIILLCLYWWFFVRKGGIDFGQMWRIAFMALAIALTIVSYLGIVPLVQVFTSAAIELALFLLWLLITAYSHHAEINAASLVAFGHLLHIAPQWLVRTLGATVGIAAVDSEIVPVFFLLIVFAVTIMLPHRSPDMQLLLSGLNPRIVGDEEQRDVATRCAEIAQTYNLTERETEIVRYLCYGRSKQYIAETMSLSENTIRTYARRAYLKLGIHTRQELQDLVWEQTS